MTGTTSACAENTCSKTWASAHSGNYLRVRGEYLTSFTIRGLKRNYLRVRGEYRTDKIRQAA